MSAGELVVGIGTLALAAVTAWLAKRTSDDVEVNRRALELSREGIDAQDRPFLVATPQKPTFDLWGTYDTASEEQLEPEWVCFVELQNHGAGPAILDGISLKDGEGTDLVKIDWKVESILLPGDEPSPQGIALGDQEPPDSGANLTLKLHYRSASGVRYGTSHKLEVATQNRAVWLDFRQTTDNAPAGVTS